MKCLAVVLNKRKPQTNGIEAPMFAWGKINYFCIFNLSCLNHSNNDIPCKAETNLTSINPHLILEYLFQVYIISAM